MDFDFDGSVWDDFDGSETPLERDGAVITGVGRSETNRLSMDEDVGAATLSDVLLDGC